jgi:hypothetical protein
MDRSESDLLIAELRREAARIAGAMESIAQCAQLQLQAVRTMAKGVEAINAEVIAHFDVIEGVMR